VWGKKFLRRTPTLEPLCAHVAVLFDAIAATIPLGSISYEPVTNANSE
jgi:hypothetical protein